VDATDRAILHELQQDGRLSNVALAERVHLSPSASLRRLKALEDTGVIRGYRAILDRRKLGLDLTVFVEVEITRHEPQQAVEFRDAIAKIDEIISCHGIAGDFEYLLHIVVPNIEAYELLHLNTLITLPGVSRIRSLIALRTFKEPGPLPLQSLQ
jgi:Lrp/AsnC family leucine-responsive transcriptional regulator